MNLQKLLHGFIWFGTCFEFAYSSPRFTANFHSEPSQNTNCIAITESADSNGWENNSICFEGISKDDFEYSSSGPIPQKSCIKISEPQAPNTWNDNFICSENDAVASLSWAFNEEQKLNLTSRGYTCSPANEPEDPNGWADNFLCTKERSPVRLENGDVIGIGRFQTIENFFVLRTPVADSCYVMESTDLKSLFLTFDGTKFILAPSSGSHDQIMCLAKRNEAGQEVYQVYPYLRPDLSLPGATHFAALRASSPPTPEAQPLPPGTAREAPTFDPTQKGEAIAIASIPSITELADAVSLFHFGKSLYSCIDCGLDSFEFDLGQKSETEQTRLFWVTNPCSIEVAIRDLSNQNIESDFISIEDRQGFLDRYSPRLYKLTGNGPFKLEGTVKGKGAGNGDLRCTVSVKAVTTVPSIETLRRASATSTIFVSTAELLEANSKAIGRFAELRSGFEILENVVNMASNDTIELKNLIESYQVAKTALNDIIDLGASIPPAEAGGNSRNLSGEELLAIENMMNRLDSLAQVCGNNTSCNSSPLDSLDQESRTALERISNELKNLPDSIKLVEENDKLSQRIAVELNALCKGIGASLNWPESKFVPEQCRQRKENLFCPFGDQVRAVGPNARKHCFHFSEISNFKNPGIFPFVSDSVVDQSISDFLRNNTNRCDNNLSFDEGIQKCTSSEQVFGPFERSEVAMCIAAGGGKACLGMRWSRDFYVNIREKLTAIGLGSFADGGSQ